MEKALHLTPFVLIFLLNLISGFLHIRWLPGEVASPLIIWGGSSAIFFLFFSDNLEERSLSLFSFFVNNLVIFFVLKSPDPCCFLVVLFFMLIAACHLFLWVESIFFLDFLFFSVLFLRIFYDGMMSTWGFGLVTELLLLAFFFKKKKKEESGSGEGSRIEPFFFLIPFFFFNFFYLSLHLHVGFKQIIIHFFFLAAGAALVYLSFFAETITELKIYISIYILFNILIGYVLANSLSTFFEITFIYLLVNLFFTFLINNKARRSNKAISSILFSNNREGIQIILVLYFLVLGSLLIQLNPGSAALPHYSNWLLGLAIQIGFLTAKKFFLKN